jgi:DNA-binding NarL/FixJ family response regulator
MIRVLLADDEPTIRRPLRMRLELEPDMRIAGEAGDGAAAVAATEELRPDVVLMDVTMPRLDGIAATKRIGKVAPYSQVVVLTLYDDAATRQRARAAGAAGFVGKHQPPDELLTAIRAVASAQRRRDGQDESRAGV